MASEAAKRSLIEHFSALEDPRQAWKVIYPLPEIMLLVLCATLAGAEDFVEARLWGVKNLDFLRRFLPFKDGLPSHDTLNDVINAPLCCTGRGRGRTGPYPVRGHAMRTDSGRPSSSMRLSAWTPTLTSVARRRSVRACSPSPITRL